MTFADDGVSVRVHVLVGDEDELLRSLFAFYSANGEAPALMPGERVVVGRKANRIVAAVRLALEKDTYVLRTLFVEPELQRHGVGSALVRALLALTDEDVFCIPFTRAERFYERAGFNRTDHVPQFLLDRAAGYAQEGHEVYVAVRRAPSPRSKSCALSAKSS